MMMAKVITLLFAKIGDKKISGSQPAGYRMKHFVWGSDLFPSFLDSGLNNVITHPLHYLADLSCFVMAG